MLLDNSNEEIRSQIMEFMVEPISAHSVAMSTGLDINDISHELGIMREEGLVGYEPNRGWYRLGGSYVEE